MKSDEQETKPKRNQYSPQFKEQALERAKRDGVPRPPKTWVWPRPCSIAGRPRAAGPANPSRSSSSSRPRLPGSSGRTPDLRRRWPS